LYTEWSAAKIEIGCDVAAGTQRFGRAKLHRCSEAVSVQQSTEVSQRDDVSSSLLAEPYGIVGREGIQQ
jgi:hypothetical protein